MRCCRRRSRDISLKYKLTSMTFIVALVPLFIFAVAIIFMYNRAIVQRSNKHIEENIRIMSDRIDTVFANGELCSNYITLNMNTICDGTGKQLAKDNQINSELNKNLLIFDGIDSIIFIDNNQRFYSTDINFMEAERKQAILTSDFYEAIEDNNGKTRLFNLENSCMSTADTPVVTMGKRVIHIVSGETLGYLFINLNVEYLRESVQNEISHYLVFDQNEYLIPRQEEENAFMNEEEMVQQICKDPFQKMISYGGDKYLIARDTIDGYGWTVIGITNLNEFNVSTRELCTILGVVGVIILALLLVATGISTSLITHPLIKLKNGAEQIANGDLDVEFRFKSLDEIGRLGNIFNDMTQKIRELLVKVDLEAKKKREYELALIQEQVKPHFLYNTLDIIIMLIEMNKSREASRVTRKLADYYKKSLSGSEEIITVEMELQMIEDYLDLQTMRYEDRFTYEIDADPQVAGAQIPKMTLQPLVENAIYHGLKYKKDWGTIHIKAEKDGDCVLLHVGDNGIGMTQEKLEEMRRMCRCARGHFGVYSVNHRLELYYGAGYGLEIDSEYNLGTTIRIRIPFAVRKRVEDD